MNLWLVIMIVSIVSVTWWGVQGVVSVGTRFAENMERIKRGYPTLEGHTPLKITVDTKKSDVDVGYIDMTKENSN